ncbi:MAG: DUF6049 family protein [Acidimicrobiales bacterium]
MASSRSLSRAGVKLAASVIGLALCAWLAPGAKAVGAVPAVGAPRSRDEVAGEGRGLPAQRAPKRSVDVPVGRDELTLLSQPLWVGPGAADFKLRVQVTASDPSRESLEVIVYGSLTTRSAFDAALSGDVYGAPYDVTGPEPLSSLVPDPQGGFDINLEVNQPGGGLPLTSTGVYPLQVFLEEGGVRMGQPLTTFLVYVDKYAQELRRLQVGLVLPLRGPVSVSPLGVPGALPSQVARALEADAADLVHWKVPVTVQADVATLESLASGGQAEKGAVGDLREALQAGDEVLPATVLPMDIPAAVRSGLKTTLEAQFRTGVGELGNLVGVTPSMGTWASAKEIDPRAAAALVAMGVKRLVLPADDLSPLPAADTKLTFAQPSYLAVPGGRALVVGADAELSARASDAGGGASCALVAYQVVAELAMIDLESPSYSRGVVIDARAGPLSPQFLGVLLSGLDGNPLLRPVTLSQLFTGVPIAVDNGVPLVRSVQAPSTPVRALPGIAGLARAQRLVSADGEVYGLGSKLVSDLALRLGTSLSSIFTGTQRGSLIAGVARSARLALSELRLPSEASITLTSRQGTLPLTVASGAGFAASVRLSLRSDQLSFVAHRLARGSCQPVSPGSETCQLVLDQPTVTLAVPVVTRASGTFPLYLVLSTPNGSWVIARAEVSVRSTAISDVGLALMVVALVFLVAWWVRNARHGRRARRLVPKDDGAPAQGLQVPGDQLFGAGSAELAPPPAKSQ